MKRISPFYAFTGFELLRFFTLAWILGEVMSGSHPQILRIMVAPNLLFAVAFFFLALDPARYGVYRPLILVGKAAAVFSTMVAVPRLLVIRVESVQIGLPVLAGLALVVVWDIMSALVLLFRRFPLATMAGNPEPSAGPEVVEVD